MLRDVPNTTNNFIMLLSQRCFHLISVTLLCAWIWDFPSQSDVLIWRLTSGASATLQVVRSSRSDLIGSRVWAGWFKRDCQSRDAEGGSFRQMLQNFLLVMMIKVWWWWLDATGTRHTSRSHMVMMMRNQNWTKQCKSWPLTSAIKIQICIRVYWCPLP